MPESNFYLGKLFDPKTAKLMNKTFEYEPANLTTHAVVTGMTGSGKTGLCIALLEEAALQGFPAIIIDPKGDLTNLLLHFPELLPSDFQPWIDPEVARRANVSEAKAAEQASEAWSDGIKEWGMDKARIMDLKNSVEFTVYTPGANNSGQLVNVLSSLKAPQLEWTDSNIDVLRERISSTVIALLGLVGYKDIDPISSREHVLLSNIFEFCWNNENKNIKNLSLEELLGFIQSPPFDKLGAFSIETLFPQKDRMVLAMTLNNILASPAFQSWQSAEQSLDIQEFLYTKDNRPRHSIFYLAHLSDNERMFFITLLLSAVETWMRSQKGSPSLRALLYMDEIYGYLPPTANPPSKQPLLRMLKQARAFGLGILLATQNPVDIDYKALSNAGTWFIGKLQTERDKNRLLDGLESLAGGIPRAQMDKLISSLGKRVFVVNNVNEKGPSLFQTRWVMNFLAGPLTRQQIPSLPGQKSTPQSNLQPSSTPQQDSTPPSSVEHVQPVNRIVSIPEINQKPKTTYGNSDGTSLSKPNLPNGIREYYLPQNYSLSEALQAAKRNQSYGGSIQGTVYRPLLLASAQVRLLDRKFNVDVEVAKSALVTSLDRRGIVRWEEFPYAGPSIDKIETMPVDSARYASIEAPLNDSKLMTALQKDFTDWVFRNSAVTARANTALKVFAGPDVSQAEFMKTCADAARDARDVEISKKASTIDKKIKSLEDKLIREERELRQDQENLRNRNIETGLSGAEALASVLGIGRKKSLSTSVSKFRMAQNAKEEVRESEEVIAQLTKEISQRQREREQVVAEVNDRWGQIVNDISEITINPKKTDIYVNIFGVAWMPYYIVQAGDESFELPAFGAE